MKPSTIITAVTAVFHCTEKELLGRRKHANVAAARLVAAHMLATRCNEGHDAIRRRFKKSAAWASWAILQCEDRAEADKAFAGKAALVAGRVAA